MAWCGDFARCGLVPGRPGRQQTAFGASLESDKPEFTMAQQQARTDIGRASVDRTRTGQNGGSIGLVLLIAVVLVGAGVGADADRPHPCRALYSVPPGRAGDGRRVPAVRARGRHAARSRQGCREPADQEPGRLGQPTRSWSPTPAGRVVYANTAYLKLVEANGADDVRPVERVFVGDPGVSEAVFRLLKAAREGRRLQEEVRVDSVHGETGAVAAHARASARRKQARGQAHGLVDRRRHPRARAAGERLPGIAARHRLSRPRAGRLLLGRCRRQHLLSQRDAGRMAGAGSGRGRLRRLEAQRHRRRRGRRAASPRSRRRPAR